MENRNKKKEAVSSNLVSHEVNRKLSDYRTARTLQKKLQATSALSLLALISSIPDKTQASRLLKMLKSLDKKE